MPDAMLRSYKRLIDDGFALPLGEALRLERTLSNAANRAVVAADVEEARKLVRARGQAQTSGKARS